jgi:hypothetical protein
METVFRVSNCTSLPLHWSYVDDWEMGYDNETGEDSVIDNREPGAQVWCDLAVLAPCLVGEDCDGWYSWKDYKLLLVIEAEKTVGGTAYPWPVVLRDNVRSVRSIPTKQVYRRFIEKYPDAYDKQWDDWDTDLLQRSVVDDEDEWIEWLIRHSKSVTPRFVETLPKPAIYEGYPVVTTRDDNPKATAILKARMLAW